LRPHPRPPLLRRAGLLSSPDGENPGNPLPSGERGGAGNPCAAVSAASALTPALSLKGEGELDSPAPSERGAGG